MTGNCDRKSHALLPFCLFIVLVALPGYAQSPALTLWYEPAAVVSDQTLPLGNGRIGAMIYGGVREEHIALNEDTLYSGEPDAVGVPKVYACPDRARGMLRCITQTTEGRVHVEIIMKDISTVRYQPHRLWEWAGIAMEEVTR